METFGDESPLCVKCSAPGMDSSLLEECCYETAKVSKSNKRINVKSYTPGAFR